MALAATTIQPAIAQDGSADEYREMELHRYRDSVRRHFVLKQYHELLELTEKYGHLYPEDAGTEFYRTQAEIRLEEAEKDIPFERLEDRDFEIPESAEGQTSLLEELRNGTLNSESGPASTSGDESQIAMGTGAIDEPVSVSVTGVEVIEGSGASIDVSVEVIDDGEGIEPTSAEFDGESSSVPPPPPPPDGESAEAAGEDEAGSSPLPFILGGAVIVLGAVAAFLLVGIMRRGRKTEDQIPAAETPTATMEPPAPPLFNFDDPEDSTGTSGTEQTDVPEPFSETATPEAVGIDSSTEAPQSAEASASSEPAPLGDTRAHDDVNQEISDLLFAPGSETGEDSAFASVDSTGAEPPPPLGETKVEDELFGASAGDDQQDLVQLADDDVFGSAPSLSETQAPPAKTPAEPEAPVDPEDAETSVADLSSIDLFGDESQASPDAGTEEKKSTTHVGLDEVDQAMPDGSDSTSAAPDLDEPSAPEASGVEIPFATEDPFQNIGGAPAEDQKATVPPEEQTTYETSTAEGLAAPGEGDETGAEERELLQIMEEPGQATPAPAPEAEAPAPDDDLWESATLDGESNVEPAPAATASGASPQSEGESAHVFEEDQTAVVEFDDVEVAEPPTAAQAEPRVSSPEADTVSQAQSARAESEPLPSDPFDRERQRGLQAVELEDWTKAVYHLSIAASLKPDAGDVRDELRRARKMKKEQQTG